MSRNNVCRCAFDQTEWHLPRYPWDWVSAVKIFCCFTSDWKKEQSQKLSEWELCNSADGGFLVNGDSYHMMFVCFSQLGFAAAAASVCPQRLTPKHCRTFCCFWLSFPFCSNRHFPPISFVILFPFFSQLYAHLPLINTYSRLYLLC